MQLQEAKLMLARALAAFPTSRDVVASCPKRRNNTTSSHHVKNRLRIHNTTAPVHPCHYLHILSNHSQPQKWPPSSSRSADSSKVHTHRNHPLSIHAQPTNQPRPPVSVLLINAIAVLSEDRFLARSTSSPTSPRARQPALSFKRPARQHS